jgi:CRISPR type I-E-associated protein CasB/Cse2
MRAAVESGISPYTEARAYPWVLPYVDSAVNQHAFLRAAAITARHTGVTNRSGYSIGRSLRALSASIAGTPMIDPAKPDGIAKRLMALITLDVDAAADQLDQMIGQAAKHKVEFDFRAIGTALLCWGDGIDERSVEVRNALLAEYYYMPRAESLLTTSSSGADNGA